MIYSVDILKESLNNSVNIKERKVEESIENTCFFIQSLDIIREDNINFYKCISSYISEGFVKDTIKFTINKIDPKKILHTILEKFMEALNNLWNKFYSLLMNFLGKDNMIKKYRKQLENMEYSVDYSEPRFIYTNLGQSTSYTSYKNEIEKEFSSLIRELSNFNDYSSIQQIYSSIENMKNDIDMTTSYYDGIRRDIVGNCNVVSKEQFVAELFNFFRNGGQKIDSSKLTPNEIRTACVRYFNYKIDLSLVKRDKESMIKTSKSVQKDIMDINIEKYVNIELPEEAIKMFYSVIENKASRVNALCNIYLQVFGAKLDAVKESYIQYRNILFAAVKQLAKEGNL